MKLTTLNRFADFLRSKDYADQTARDYVAIISALDDPPTADDTNALYAYIDHALNQNKPVLSNSSFASFRASVNAFFLMQTGIPIAEYRRRLSRPDEYDLFLQQYGAYRRNFLRLTEPVTLASIREVKAFLKVAAPNIQQTEWSSFTADEVVSYLRAERSGLRVSSLGVTVTAIRRFFRFLQHTNQPIHDSVLTLPLSVPAWSKGGPLPIVLSTEEQEKLNEYSFSKTPTGIRDHLILLCFTELGLRCCEVAALQMSDISWHRSTILIRPTKTRQQRELPISTKLGTALEDYILHARPKSLGKYLFFKNEKQTFLPASVETIRGVVRRTFDKNGIAGWHVGTHALRRTFGSRLYSTGNDLKTVADLLGHTSVSTTKAYVRIDTAALRLAESSWPRRKSNEQ